MSSLLGTPYRQMYENYYDRGIARKRELAAQDTFAHVHDLVGAKRFGTAVDVGAGEGSLLAALNDSGLASQLFALEISDSGLQAIAARNLARLQQCLKFDGYEIPFADGFFDLVVCMHVLEHVEHERLLLRELRRIGKRFVFEVPLENGIRVERAIATSGPFGHINFYSPATFLNLLRTSGFRIIRARVYTSSRQYEQHCAGRVRGLVKHGLRRGLLALSRQLAPNLLTYVMAVYCEPESNSTEAPGTAAPPADA